MNQNNPSIQNGLIAGVLGIILQMLFYFLGGGMLFKWWTPWLVFFIVLFFMITSANQAKKMNGGYISLKEALQQSWVTALIAIVLLSVFKYLLFNVIDPGLVDQQLEAVMEQTEKFAGMFGGGDVDFDDLEDQMRKNIEITLPKLLLGILISMILHFIPAIIIAAIVKKKRPETEAEMV